MKDTCILQDACTYIRIRCYVHIGPPPKRILGNQRVSSLGLPARISKYRKPHRTPAVAAGRSRLQGAARAAYEKKATLLLAGTGTEALARPRCRSGRCSAAANSGARTIGLLFGGDVVASPPPSADYRPVYSQVVSATPPSIAIEALVLGGPERVRVVCFTASNCAFLDTGTSVCLVCVPAPPGVFLPVHSTSVEQK
jgi:hypothetical protein